MTPSAVLDRPLAAALAFGAGLATGLLLAPRAGGATRHRLAASARDAAGAARDRTAGLAEPLADAARDRARRLSERHLPFAGDLDVIDARDVLGDLHAGRP